MKTHTSIFKSGIILLVFIISFGMLNTKTSFGQCPFSLSYSVTLAGTPAGTIVTPPGSPIDQGMGGAIITITNPAWPVCSNWGYPTTMPVLNGYCVGAPTYHNLTFNSLDPNTNLNNGLMCFTGTTTYRYMDLGGFMVTNNAIPARVRIRVTLTDGVTPIPIQQAGSYLLLQTDQDFRVWYFIEAFSPLNAQYFFGGSNIWMGAINLFNALHTDPASYIQTTFDYGAYYNINGIGISAGALTNPVCYGDNIDLTGNTGNLDLGCTTPVFFWSGPNGFSSTSQNPSIGSATPIMSGLYTYAVSDLICYGLSTENILVYDDLAANISGGTTPICYNSSPGTFTATGSGGTGSYTYLWYQNGVAMGVTTQTYDPGNLTTTPNTYYCEVSSVPCGTVVTPTTQIDFETVPPVITCPADVITTTNNGCSAINVSLGTPVTSDNCNVASVINNAPAVFPLGNTTVTWTATDGAGNTATCNQTVTVNDNVNPTIFCMPDIEVPTDAGLCTASGVVLTTPVTLDNCSVFSVNNDAPAVFPQGPTTVTWTVTDGAGLTSTCIQLVTVIDNEDPAISCAADVNIDAYPGLCSATLCENSVGFSGDFDPVNWTTSLINSDGTVNAAGAPLSITITSGDNGGPGAGWTDYSIPITCNGTITFDWNYSTGDSPDWDYPQYSVDGGALYTVFPSYDQLGFFVQSGSESIPVVSGQIFVYDMYTRDNQVGRATIDISNFNFVATVGLPSPITYDNCGVASVTNDHPSDNYPVGTTNLTWTVTDINGNTNNCVQKVIINDNEDPTITCPADVITTTNDGCTAINVAIGTPVTADNCSVTSVTNNAPAVFPLGNTTVIWTVTDGAGNTAACNQLVTVNDNINPTIFCMPNVVVNTDAGTCTASGVVLQIPATSDNCSINSVTNDAPALFPLGNTTVTWTVTDGAGNTATCVQIVTVIDNISPAITCPAAVNTTTNTGCTATGVNLGVPITADNCIVSSVTNNAPAVFPLGNTTVIWTVTDGSGNTATCAQIVTVNDTVMPSITCPADINMSANLGCTATGVSLGIPVTGDNCHVASVTNDAPAIYPIGTTTVTWTVTDDAGNVNTCAQLVTITEDTDPVIFCPPAVVAFTNTACTATGVALGNPVIIENCIIDTVYNDAPAAFPLGNTTVTWTVIDGSGNSDTCTQLVTILDNVNPTISCPADVIATTNTGCTATGVNLGVPITADNCIVSSVTNNAPAVFPLGNTTVIWTVTDGSGNTATCAQIVTVNDNIIPSITCPADINMSANLGCTATGVSLGIPVTGDNCHVASVTNNAPGIYPIGTTTVTWTVMDDAGNINTCAQLVTITEDTNPVIFCPPAVVAYTNTACTATSVDLGNPVIIENCIIDTVYNDAPAAFPLGNTTVIWTVIDGSGNSDTCTQLVTILDNVNPTITCPVDVVTTTNTGCTATGVSLGVPVTADNCTVASVTNNAPAAFPLGNTTVIWTVTDGAGNTATCTQLVTVSDNVIPAITCPADVVATTNNGCTAIGVLLGSPVTSDNCHVASVTNNSSGIFPLGVTTVIWTVTDDAGNTNTCSQLVTITDNVSPIVYCPQNITINTNTGCTATGVVLDSPFVIENCSIDTIYNDAPAAFPLGNTTVTWTVIDGSGNGSTCTQVVTVIDNVNPTITCPANIIETTNSGCTATGISLGIPVTSDNCNIDTVFNDAPLVFPLGNTIVTWTIVDSAGNSANCTQLVSVIDTIIPTIICPPDVLANTNLGCTATGVYLGIPVTSDNCHVASVTNDGTGIYPIGNTTVTWTVTDDAGNTGTCTQLVTVIDNVSPLVSCPPNIVSGTNSGCTATGVDLNNPFIIENCTVDTVYNDAPAAFPLGNTTVTWTVIDNSGNGTTCTQIVTVIDDVPPTITCPATVVGFTDSGCNPTAISLGLPIVSDNCSVDTVTNDAPAVFPFGNTIVTWTVIDTAGNSTSCQQMVTINDTITPTITCPADVVTFINTGCTATGVNLGIPVTADNCSVASVSNNAPAAFQLGITTVTWTVTDVSGNQATCIQTVTVIDTISPTITCPADINTTTNVGCTATGIPLGTPVTSDNCIVASVMNDSPGVFPLGNTTVIWTVTDASGNTNTCAQLVTVTDDDSPVLSCPSAITVATNTGCTATGVNLGSPLIIENCSTASVVNDAPVAFPLGNTTVTWTVTDAAGNSATCTQVVTVIDNIDPVIACPADIVVFTNSGCTATGVNLGLPVTSDNCSVASVNNNGPSVYETGNTIVIWTVTDNTGNTSTCQQIVTVIDSIHPTISCPADINVVSEPGACDYTGIILGFPTFSDNCGIVTIVNNATTTLPIGTTQVIWTATDGSGNISTCVQIINVASAPLAVNDTASTTVNTPVLIPVLANDIDCGNNLNPASVIVAFPAANGTTTVDPVTGSITYTPDNMFSGNDQFVYQVCDSNGVCSTATVFVDVTSGSNPAVLGLAKMVLGVIPQDDNFFDVTYVITVENLGSERVENIQVTDDLLSVFGSSSTFSILEAPHSNNNLTPNLSFDGSNDINLLVSNTSYLDIGNSGTITFTVRIKVLGSMKTFCNTAITTGYGLTGVFVNDTSDNGYITDANENGNPGDAGENDCTPVTLTPDDVFIPQAISPEGDGKNDFFVIQGIENYPDNELTIFNRWGNKVYYMSRYDNSWGGLSDNVLTMGSNKLPTGTYYYIFEYNKDDRPPKEGFVVIKY